MALDENFILQVQAYCRWIAAEIENYRHSDVCRLGYCNGWGRDLLTILERKEEEIEGLN